MEVLFLGNLKLVSPRFFDMFTREHDCVAIKRANTYMRPGEGLKVYESHNKKEFDNLMVAHHFDAIIFFAYNLDNSSDVNMEFEHLRDILSLAKKYETKMFFYVRSNESETIDEGSILETRTRNIVDGACEELCEAFQQSSDIIMRIIRIPYVFSMEFADNKISYLMKAAIQGHEIVFRADPEREIDAICDEDLGFFIMRVLDDPMDDDIRTINIGGGNHMTYGALADLYSKVIRGLKVSWIKSDDKNFFSYQEDTRAQEDFGWRPFHRLEGDILDIYDETFEEINDDEKRIKEVETEKSKTIFSVLKFPIDIVFVMGIAEVLTYIAPDKSYFSSWDIRLIAVLLLGMVDGMAIGLVGAAIASLLYIIDIMTSKNIEILFKEPGTLIPIVFFILVGNISGFLCDRKNDDVDNANREAQLQSEQYEFLSKLYDKTRETRENFKNQILGFRNSYGRIYALLRRIEDAEEQNMFAEAVAGTEEIMDSKNVSIFIRIGTGENYTEQAHSMWAVRKVPETINLKEYPDMYSLLKDGETFINRELKEGYPAFATAIRSGDEMSGIIMLTDAEYRQMNVEYADKFSVVAGIISTDLIRAMRLHEDLESQMEGAKIMKKEDFAKLLSAYCDQKGEMLEQHSLLHVKIVNMTVKEAVRRVSAIIRGDDVIGADENNRVLLLLPNTFGKGIEIVKEKLKTAGIDTEILRSISE